MEKMHARRKIKTHLKEKGEHYIEVTPETCKKWWHVLNHAVFDGMLDVPKRFHCRNFRDESLGWCLPVTIVHRDGSITRECELAVRREVDDRKQFLTILVHEMVHQWEWMHKGRMGHGVNFHSWKGRVYRLTRLPLGEHI